MGRAGIKDWTVLKLSDGTEKLVQGKPGDVLDWSKDIEKWNKMVEDYDYTDPDTGERLTQASGGIPTGTQWGYGNLDKSHPDAQRGAFNQDLGRLKDYDAMLRTRRAQGDYDYSQIPTLQNWDRDAYLDDQQSNEEGPWWTSWPAITAGTTAAAAGLSRGVQSLAGLRQSQDLRDSSGKPLERQLHQEIPQLTNRGGKGGVLGPGFQKWIDPTFYGRHIAHNIMGIDPQLSASRKGFMGKLGDFLNPALPNLQYPAGDPLGGGGGGEGGRRRRRRAQAHHNHHHRLRGLPRR